MTTSSLTTVTNPLTIEDVLRAAASLSAIEPVEFRMAAATASHPKLDAILHPPEEPMRFIACAPPVVVDENIPVGMVIIRWPGRNPFSSNAIQVVDLRDKPLTEGNAG